MRYVHGTTINSMTSMQRAVEFLKAASRKLALSGQEAFHRVSSEEATFLLICTLTSWLSYLELEDDSV